MQPNLDLRLPRLSRIGPYALGLAFIGTGIVLAVLVPDGPGGDHRMPVRVLYLGAWALAALAGAWTALRARRAPWRFRIEA